MPYRHVFFDLDHTLWDFERCSAETLTELFTELKMDSQVGLDPTNFVATFQRVNRHLWQQFGAGQITQQQLRESRFRVVLGELGVTHEEIPNQLTEQYLHRCSRKPHLQPYAREVLDYLKHHYTLHIITNGFADVQQIKLASAGILDYFTHLVTSHQAGCHKPDRRIFDHALRLAATHPVHCLMIGDNLETDMAGARNAGLDHVFYNYEQVAHAESPTYEITCLSELMQLL